MKNKRWKQFDKLTEKCYSNMLGNEADNNCWQQAFDLLKEIILEERKENPNYAPEIEMLEEETDYAYDIDGWMEDCLDEMEMNEKYEAVLRMSEDLLNLFGWPDYTGSDIKSRKVFSLLNLGRAKEAVMYSRKWVEKEPENIVAATACVYALTEVKAYEEAQKLIDRFILDADECDEENDMMFMAASKFYEATCDKKSKIQVEKAMAAYEKYLEEYMEGLGEEDMEEFWDEDLPF